MSDEVADVLIVGSGASGAAIAWSLADTRMKILCLEQGDWMDPGTFPSTNDDWELRRFGDFVFGIGFRLDLGLDVIACRVEGSPSRTVEHFERAVRSMEI